MGRCSIAAMYCGPMVLPRLGAYRALTRSLVWSAVLLSSLACDYRRPTGQRVQVGEPGPGTRWPYSAGRS
jgi:hypothetical protein